MRLLRTAIPILALTVCWAFASPLTPSIRVLSPNGGEVLTEGETYEVRWKAEDVISVRIAVAVGGKERGHLGEGEPLDARTGSYSWTIPQGFVTGFGVSEARNARIMIYDAQDPKILDLSDGFFTITGPRPPEDEQAPPPMADDSEYKDAIVRYFDALSSREFRRAYDMLSECKIVLTDADGSAVAFRPRQDYERWRTAQESVRKIEVKRVERLNSATSREERDAGRSADALTTLGIRMYKVHLSIELSREDWTVRSGENTVFLYVVKGSDGRIRILEIGSGP